MESTPSFAEMEHKLRMLQKQNELLEKELFKSKENQNSVYKDLFQQLVDPCIIFEAFENGTDFIIKDLNPALEQLEGIEKVSVVGRKVTDVFPESKKEILIAFRKVFTNNESVKFTFHGKKLSGEEVWRENIIFKLSSGEVVSLYSDSTELKKNQLELASNEARYRALSNATNEAVWFTVDGFCIDFNKTALSMFGLTAEEALGAHALTIIDEAYHEDTIHKLKTNYLKPYLSVGVHKSGKRFPIQIQGRIFDFKGKPTRITTMRDISDFKGKETALLNSEARYKALSDAATEAVFIMENGKCIDINEKASEVYGYSREEAIGIPILDLIAPESKELVRQKFSLAYAEPYQGWCIRKNGEIFPAELRGKNFEYVGRKVRISTIRDISVQKQAERKLAKSEAKFRAYFEEHTAIKLQIDVETKMITDANKAAVQFYGYTLEELKSLSIFDLNALPKKEVLALMQQAKSGEKSAFSFPHRLKSGELKNVETYTSIIEVDGRKYFFSILHDVTESKKTEEELKRSEARFRAYFENNTAAMLQVDPLTKEIVAANKAALVFYGYSIEEFKRLKVYDINVLNKEEINQKMKSVMSSSAQDFIFKHRLSSGEIREVEVYASPIKTLSESQLFITIYDVTEREKNKRDLEQNERKLNEAQSIAKIGNWEYDYETEIMTWSDEIYKIFEVDVDYQLDHANYNRLIHPEDLEKVNQDFSEAMKNKRPYFNVHRIITPNGHIKYIEENGYGIYDENGEIIQSVGTAQDVTLQKNAENKLLQNEKYLHEAQRIAKVGNFELDLQTKEVNWSEEVDRIFGYDAASGEKQYLFYRNLIHPDDVENVDREFQKAKKDNRGYSLVYRIISAFGEIKYIEEKGYFEYEKDKNKTIVIGTLQDITISHFIKKDLEDSKAKLAEINKGLEIKVQEELKKSREKDHLLIQQSRHAVLGEMIGNIAHQWRQPLNEVSLLINDLEDAYSFGVLNKEYFDKTIEIVYRRLKFMSDTINDFSKMHTDDFKAENFKPNLLIEKLIQFIEENFKKYKIKIKFMYDAEFEVYGYPNMLSHVILNLLNNSKDILTEREVKAPKIWIKLEQNTENYIIRILDNGKGVSSAYIDKIFDPYFTTKDKKRGSGLGLYMAKSMIEEHMKGRIEVQNQREGAEFTITLNTNEDR